MNVYQKIAEVMKDISYLQKDDNVKTGYDNYYKAITEEKVTSAVRASLINHGLVIIPVKQDRTTSSEIVIDKKGNQKNNHLVEVDTQYRIQNIDDAEDYIIAVSSGSGVDTQDKGVGKAMTYSYKYLLLRTFAIPTGEDPDKVSSDIYSNEFMSIQTISKVQAKTLVEIARNKGFTGTDWVLDRCHVERLGEITNKQYAELMAELENM